VRKRNPAGQKCGAPCANLLGRALAESIPTEVRYPCYRWIAQPP
jgi:hypothetical protein